MVLALMLGRPASTYLDAQRGVRLQQMREKPGCRRWPRWCRNDRPPPVPSLTLPGYLIEGRDVVRSFGETQAPRGANVSIAGGEIVAVMGAPWDSFS